MKTIPLLTIYCSGGNNGRLYIVCVMAGMCSEIYIYLPSLSHWQGSAVDLSTEKIIYFRRCWKIFVSFRCQTVKHSFVRIRFGTMVNWEDKVYENFLFFLLCGCMTFGWESELPSYMSSTFVSRSLFWTNCMSVMSIPVARPKAFPKREWKYAAAFVFIWVFSRMK